MEIEDAVTIPREYQDTRDEIIDSYLDENLLDHAQKKALLVNSFYIK